MKKSRNQFLAKVRKTIRRYGMLSEGDGILVAVSGGPDSVALLHALVALGPEWSLRLAVAHVNHRIRGKTAEQEAAFVEGLAQSLALPCEATRIDVKGFARDRHLSLQEAGRACRYRFFHEACARLGLQKTALGHQADDNAESILMHLFRGTGPTGLTGIPPVREACIIRPLIEIPRGQILRFLEDHDLAFCEDRSNEDRRYLRNRVRHEVVPFLTERFGTPVAPPLNRLSDIMREEEDYWEQQVRQTLDVLLVSHEEGAWVLAGSKLASLHPALFRRLVRHVLLQLAKTTKRVGHGHIQAVFDLVTGRRPSGCLDLPHGVVIRRDGGHVVFQQGPPAETPPFEHRIPGPGTTVIPEIGKQLRLSVYPAHEVTERLSTLAPGTGLFDLDRVSFPLLVRNVRPGDRFIPLGMSGSQKVYDFLVNRKIPRSKRMACPLLLSRETIIWVGPYRIAEPAKVTTGTREVLRVDLEPASN